MHRLHGYANVSDRLSSMAGMSKLPSVYRHGLILGMRLRVYLIVICSFVSFVDGRFVLDHSEVAAPTIQTVRACLLDRSWNSTLFFASSRLLSKDLNSSMKSVRSALPYGKRRPSVQRLYLAFGQEGSKHRCWQAILPVREEHTVESHRDRFIFTRNLMALLKILIPKVFCGEVMLSFHPLTMRTRRTSRACSWRSLLLRLSLAPMPMCGWSRTALR